MGWSRAESADQEIATTWRSNPVWLLFKGLTKDSSPSILIARQSSSNTPSSPSGKPCFETKVNKVLANQSKLDLRIYQMAFSFVPIL